MDAQQIEQLLRVLGCEKIKYGSRWVNASCPFASSRHSKGSDRRPSFGVLVSEGVSHYRCLACGVVGDLHGLIWTLSRHRGTGRWYWDACRLLHHETPSASDLERMSELADTPIDARERLERSNYWGPPAPRQTSRALNLDTLEYPVLAESDLQKFRDLPPVARDYLTGPKRKLQLHTIDIWELGWQPYSRRIVIPVRDWDGRLVGLTGRAVDPDNDPKFLHSTGFKRDYFLFGEHMVERGESGYLVEGHFDVIYLRQMGYPNAVAVMGSHLSVVQVEKLIKMFPDVTIIPDGDQAGGDAAAKWEYALRGRVPVRVATVMEGRDPDEYAQDELDELLALDYSSGG